MGWSINRPTGLTYHRPQQSVQGHTLVTPQGGDSTYLTDMDGRIVRRWRFDGMRPGYGRLPPNGHLLLRGVDASTPPPRDDPTKQPPPFERHVRRLGGNATQLWELDGDGEHRLIEPVQRSLARRLELNTVARATVVPALRGVGLYEVGEP